MTTEYKPTQLMIDWIAELRNPNRVQADGALCTMDTDGSKSYCCLGVLEEVAGNVAKEIPNTDFVGSINLAFYGPTAKGETGLPSAVLISEVLGDDKCTDNITLGYDTDGSTVVASEANDDFNWSFGRIADQLEKVYVLGTGDPQDYTIEDLERPSPSDSDCW